MQRNGYLLVPNMRGRTSTDSERTREFPFGRPILGQPEVLFVCLNMTHRDRVAHIFQQKGMYILWRSIYLAGYMFNAIVTFDPFYAEFTDEERWEYFQTIRRIITTRSRPGCEVTRYMEEQQRNLGI